MSANGAVIAVQVAVIYFFKILQAGKNRNRSGMTQAAQCRKDVYKRQVIDTAISSFSGGSSQPATETLVYALEELGIHTGIDQSVLKKINEHFTSVRQEALTDGTLNPIVLTTDTNALLYQIPGGMLSNLISQLKTQHAEHRFYEVLQEDVYKRQV